MPKEELTVLYVAAFERLHMIYMEFKYKGLKNKNKKYLCRHHMYNVLLLDHYNMRHLDSRFSVLMLVLPCL